MCFRGLFPPSFLDDFSLRREFEIIQTVCFFVGRLTSWIVYRLAFWCSLYVFPSWILPILETIFVKGVCLWVAWSFHFLLPILRGGLYIPCVRTCRLYGGRLGFSCKFPGATSPIEIFLPYSVLLAPKDKLLVAFPACVSIGMTK